MMTAIAMCYQPPPPFEIITLTAHDGKLQRLDWGDVAMVESVQTSELTDDNPNHKLLRQAIVQLDEYFAGVRQVFELPLDLSAGTEFQKRVWQALQGIGYGQTISYKALAQRVGSPNAYRACGQANGKNPIALIVPCHRVVSADGGLGGYSFGADIKQRLLDFEHLQLQICQ